MTQQAPKTPRVPRGLSTQARNLWTELHAANFFELHEEVALEHALKWQDASDQLMAEAAGLKGRERTARLRSAGDAAAVSLRYLRTLRFSDPSQPARRPGRPPGKPWAASAAEVMSLRRVE